MQPALPLEPAIESVDEDDYHDLIPAHRGNVLVIFTGSGCFGCQVLRRSLLKMLAGGERLTVFEVDAHANRGLVEEFDVFHLPAMFLYKDGEFHAELTSPPLPDRLRSAIRDALVSPAREAPECALP
jgi:thioredoxin-like negative regulator of GroEL